MAIAAAGMLRQVADGIWAACEGLACLIGDTDAVTAGEPNA